MSFRVIIDLSLLLFVPLSASEMNYDATKSEEPAGEVLLRGPQLFSGYYKAPDKTAEVRVLGFMGRRWEQPWGGGMGTLDDGFRVS